MHGTVRPAAVAGTFYPRQQAALSAMVADLLTGSAEPRHERPPVAYVVPHAGLVYSGHVAAHVYRQLRGAVPPRILLLGPTHRVACRGIALSGVRAFDTPLGQAQVDTDLAAALADVDHVTTRPDVHADEHALEVQLPFLQTVCPGVPVLPVCVGDADSDEVAAVIDASLAYDEQTLILVSSDLSHFLADAEARAIDAVTISSVLALSGPIDHRRACGAAPLNGLLVAAARRGWTPELLSYATSADTIGDRARVVGYAALRFDRTDHAAA
jgi:AmmeMemoRadiSam system protein B